MTPVGEKPTEDGEQPKHTMADIEREGYANADRKVVELPEMVELISNVTGEVPRIRKSLGKQLGIFRDDTGVIDIIHTLKPDEMLKVLGQDGFAIEKDFAYCPRFQPTPLNTY